MYNAKKLYQHPNWCWCRFPAQQLAKENTNRCVEKYETMLRGSCLILTFPPVGLLLLEDFTTQKRYIFIWLLHYRKLEIERKAYVEFCWKREKKRKESSFWNVFRWTIKYLILRLILNFQLQSIFYSRQCKTQQNPENYSETSSLVLWTSSISRSWHFVSYVQ